MTFCGDHDSLFPTQYPSFCIAYFKNSLVSKVFNDVLTLLVKHPLSIFLLNSKDQKTTIEISLPRKKKIRHINISNCSRNNPMGLIKI